MKESNSNFSKIRTNKPDLANPTSPSTLIKYNTANPPIVPVYRRQIYPLDTRRMSYNWSRMERQGQRDASLCLRKTRENVAWRPKRNPKFREGEINRRADPG